MAIFYPESFFHRAWPHPLRLARDDNVVVVRNCDNGDIELSLGISLAFHAVS